jgi:uncharacterized protein YifN (PemK superfamily)
MGHLSLGIVTMSLEARCGHLVIRRRSIVKRRPVIVVASEFGGASLVSVVPLSTRAPEPMSPWHVRLSTDRYGFLDHRSGEMWAKCDLVTHVAYSRLDRLRLDGAFARCVLAQEDFASVLQGVASWFHCSLGEQSASQRPTAFIAS